MRHAIQARKEAIAARSNQAKEELDMSTQNTKRSDRTPDDNATSTRDSRETNDGAPTNTQKDPDEWVTGGESMTGAQASYLKTLSEEAGEPFEDGLTKAEASKKIDELQSETGRGIDH
jgi:hypothetical protein